MTTFWSLLALAFATSFFASRYPRRATWANAMVLLGPTCLTQLRILTLEVEVVG